LGDYNHAIKLIFYLQTFRHSDYFRLSKTESIAIFRYTTGVLRHKRNFVFFILFRLFLHSDHHMEFEVPMRSEADFEKCKGWADIFYDYKIICALQCLGLISTWVNLA